MNKNKNARSSLIKLYNPKKEGLGNYDVNYMNAYKKNEKRKAKSNYINNERHAA